MRPKRQFRTASYDNYLDFRRKNPSVQIEYKIFKKIIYTWNEFFANYIIESGEMLSIPHGIGSLAITKYKPRRERTTKSGKVMHNGVINGINWQETKKEGKYIFYLNHETDGFRFFWYWNPSKSYIKNSALWKLEMARVHSRNLAALLKKPNNNRKELYKNWTYRQ